MACDGSQLYLTPLSRREWADVRGLKAYKKRFRSDCFIFVAFRFHPAPALARAPLQHTHNHHHTHEHTLTHTQHAWPTGTAREAHTNKYKHTQAHRYCTRGTHKHTQTYTHTGTTRVAHLLEDMELTRMFNVCLTVPNLGTPDQVGR